MKKLMIAAGAAALLAASSLTVLAAEATGMITKIDATQGDSIGGTVTLDGGKVYVLPMTVAITDFKVGQTIKITFDVVPSGNLMASAISMAPVAGAPAPAQAGGAPAAADGRNGY